MEENTQILDKSYRRRHLLQSSPYLVHIYPPGPNMGFPYPLGGGPVILGRDAECHIYIDDESASRRHACIQPEETGFFVVDLQSTNGTFVNQVRVTNQKLQDGDYVQVANCIYRFLGGGNVEAEYHEEIYRMTIVDGLTGIHNKRYLLDLLSRDLTCAGRYHRPLALILFDIDHFKAINDRQGHLAGDSILRQLAGCLKGSIRKEDVFARFGGDEFALHMPETTLAGGLEIGERLRQIVANHQFQYSGQTFHLTISMGLAALSGGEGLTSAEFLRRADEKLYQAKNQGRNRIAS